jgi:hypothetical protein
LTDWSITPMPLVSTSPQNIKWSFGKWSSEAANSLLSDLSTHINLTRRNLGDAVKYEEPPIGQGLDRQKWGRVQDMPSERYVYELKASTADLEAAVPLTKWRDQVKQDFPAQVCADINSDGARQLAEFAQALLNATADLHQKEWRLGLIDPDNLYLVPGEGGTVRLFMPDLGFAWLGTDPLAIPNCLATSDRDLVVWGEKPTTRQYAAPVHYQQHMPGVDRDERVKRDLIVVARLLGFVLTGDLATRPPDAGRCPFWQVIKEAEAGHYKDFEGRPAAEAMRESLLKKLMPPPVVAPAEKGRRRAAWTVGLCLVVLVGGGLVAWRPWNRPMRTVAPRLPEGADIAARARQVLDDIKERPDQPAAEKDDKLTKIRQDLLVEIGTDWERRTESHIPLRTVELLDLLEQLDEALDNTRRTPS